jgi:hypothetical protein|tara:strand:- start:2159 stop:2599 length:441 start_codon:yes stop_codon:yes gene_type:complete
MYSLITKGENMNITEMNRANAKLVREILTDKLPSILNEHGLSFELGNARFDEDGVRFTGFRLSVKGALSETEKALRDELDSRNIYGVELDPNKIAKLDGKDFSLVGFKPRARKKPFVIQDLNSDDQYVIGEALAEKLFKKDEGGQS